MKRNRFFHILAAIALMAGIGLTAASCSEDKLGETIFPEPKSELDPNSYSYQLDKWLKTNFLDVYNLDYQYKMEDVGTNMNYNLVPASYSQSLDVAVLTKYLWFDAYKEVTGSEEFLKTYGPRIIMLIGSPAYNPTSGTMILGLAEGGIKVSIFRVNEMNTEDFASLNEYMFKTMHHEFSHILHQTKTIPREFQLISLGHYDSSNWQDRDEGVVASLGFISTYGSSEMREDFAEIIANYITKTQEDWDHWMDMASRGWATDAEDELADDVTYYCYYYYKNNDASNGPTYCKENQVVHEGNNKYFGNSKDSSGNRIIVYDVEDTDGVDGVAVLNQKVQIARTWFAEEWGIDLDKLRATVQYRQLNFNLEELRKQVTDIK